MANPAFVQAVGTASESSGAISITTTGGNCLVVFSASSNPTTHTISDTAGNTYRRLCGCPAGNQLVAVWVALNVANGANTITLTNGDGYYFGCAAIEYSGIATVRGVESVNFGGVSSGSGPYTMGCGNATTAYNNDMLVVAYANSGYGNTYTAGTDFTMRVSGGSSAHKYLGVQDYLVPTAGTHATAMTCSVNPGTFGGTVLVLSGTSSPVCCVNKTSVYHPNSSNYSTLAAGAFTTNTGNAILVAIGLEGQNISIVTGVTDTTGTNVYTAVPGGSAYNSAGNKGGVVFYLCPGATGNANNVVTASFSSPGSFRVGMTAWEIENVSSTPDAIGVGTGTSATIATAAFVPTVNYDLIIAAGCDTNAFHTTTPSTGYTSDFFMGVTSGYDTVDAAGVHPVENRILPTAGSITAGWGVSTSTNWAVVGLALTEQLPTVSLPTFDIAAGYYGPTQNVTISDTDNALTGFQIYYTTNGDTPDNTKTAYTYGTTIPISASCTLKAIAYATGYLPSAVQSAAYIIGWSGNCGVASAKVFWAGTENVLTAENSGGYATADGSGNYLISGLNNGTYLITPMSAGHAFTPVTTTQAVSGGVGKITSLNFTATAISTTYQVKDNFLRADSSSLGGNWSPQFLNYPYTDSCGLGGIQVKNHAFAPASAPQWAWALQLGSSFGNDQYAEGTFSAVADYESTIAITGATYPSAASGAGYTDYAYTLTAGQALKAIQWIRVTGMAQTGNNNGATGYFQVHALGSGFVTLVNASGVTESGSSGVGISPSDSNCGVMVRGTPDGKNGYIYIRGTNSFDGTGRFYCAELWKIVNGVMTLLSGPTYPTVQDSPGDVILLSAIGSSVVCYKNGVAVNSATDTDLTSGLPGIVTWSLDGPNQQDWSNWGNPTDMAAPPASANSGTQWTNFVGGTIGAPAGGSANSFVQANSAVLGTENTNNSPATTLAYTSPNQVGDLLFATINWYDTGTPGTVAASDTQGNVWHALPAVSEFGYTTIGFYALNCKAGANTVIFTWSAGSATVTLVNAALGEWSGVNAIDQHAECAAQSQTLTPVSQTILTLQSDELLVAYGDTAAWITANWSSTVGEVWTPRTTNPTASVLADQLNAGQSIYTAALTRDGTLSNYTAVSIAAFYSVPHSISGNAGIAGATIACTGQTSTTSAGDGSWSFSGLLNGIYTITPSKTGYTFSPTSASETVNGANITGVDFGATQTLVATPTFSPVAGSYGSTQNVTISSTDSGLTGFAITYTTDGSTPVPGSHGTVYSGVITVSITQTIKAVASATSYANSVEADALYTINSSSGYSSTSGLQFSNMLNWLRQI